MHENDDKCDNDNYDVVEIKNADADDDINRWWWWILLYDTMISLVQGFMLYCCQVNCF